MVQLSQADGEALRTVLPTIFTREEFDAVLTDNFGQDRRLDRVTSNAALDVQVVEVLGRATAEGWLATLVLGAAKARAGIAEIQRLANVVRKQIMAIEEAAKSDPFDVIWLSRSRPLVNRRNLRTRAKEMFVNDLARVMIVRGKTKTGRSHSMFFFQHLATNLAKEKGFEVVDLNLVRLVKLKTRLNAYQLALIVNESFGIDFAFAPNDEDKQDAFKIEPFAQAFIRVVKKKPERAVLIVDGFDHVEPEESGLQLIHRLAVAAEDSLTNLRVVLLGHDEDLLLEIGAPPLHEETADFTDDEVGGFFERFYREVLGQNPPNGDDVIRDSIAALRAAPAGQPNVTAVSEKITQICRDLIAKRNTPPALAGAPPPN